jgi:hypothetical protein
MGGAHSRSKGRRGELEVLARLNAIGGDGVLNYGQEELSGANGDVQTNYGQFEVKRRAAFPSWMTIADDVRGVYCRRDHGPWMVLLRADDAELLLAASRELAKLKYGPSDFPVAK